MNTVLATTQEPKLNLLVFIGPGDMAIDRLPGNETSPGDLLSGRT